MAHRRVRRILVGFVAAALVAACLSPPPSQSPAAAPPSGTAATPVAAQPPGSAEPSTAELPPIGEHPIAIRTVDGRAEFFDRTTGLAFVPRGANYVRFERNAEGAVVDRLFADYDAKAVKADLRAMRRLGYTAVRIGLELCREDCIGDPRGGLRSDYLANLADFLRQARDEGLPVLINSNDLPEEGGWVPRVEATCCSPFDGYMNSQYLSPTGLETYREYWTAALQGLRDAGAPLEAILAYEVRGEVFVTADTPPLSLGSGTVTAANGETYDLADPAARQRLVDDGVVHWIDEMASAVRAIDPGALVAVGAFAPDTPNAWRNDPRAPPTVATFLNSSVDFIDVHLYPGYIPIDDLLENFAVHGDEPVPVVIGEFGAFTFAYPDASAGAGGLMRWQADSCDAGADGWFHWHWRGTSDAEVWTGTDGDGEINTVLSPRERPDPCAVRSFPFLRENLALGATARASASLDDRGPELAIDGQPGTGWLSGQGPPQWIEIDLRERATIETLRLVVDQSPAGRTVHVVSGGPSRKRLKELHTFDERTDFGDELVWTPTSPLTGIRVLRIETSRSPSWVAWSEIEAIGTRP
jgi:hypothetical protein